MRSSKETAFVHFSDNLEERGDYDLIIRILPVFVVVLMPLLLTMLISYGPIVWPSVLGRFEYLDVEQSGLSVMIIFEFFIIGIVISRMYKRLWSHAKRDRDWRQQLLDYARSEGKNVGELKRLNDEGNKIGRFYGRIPAAMIVAMLYMFIFGFYFYVLPKSEDGLGLGAYSFNVGFVLVAALFVFVFIKVLTFPYKHEDNQIRFMEEFRAVTGLNIPPMEHTVKHHNILIHILLVIVTLGLYLLVLLYGAFDSMNKHIKNQWSYENELFDVLCDDLGVAVTSGKREDPDGGAYRLPLTLYFAELFLMFMIGSYILKMFGIAGDIEACRQLYDITMLPETMAAMGSEEQFKLLLKYLMVLWNVVFVGLSIEAMMALVSGRSKAWRNVVRNCLTFTIPTWISYYLYNPESFTHLFDLNPYVTTAVLYVLLLFMFISVDVKRFYTPPTMDVPKTAEWLRFAVHGDLNDV